MKIECPKKKLLITTEQNKNLESGEFFLFIFNEENVFIL